MSDNNNQLVKRREALDLMSPDIFAQVQRVALGYVTASTVPEAYRGKENLGNVIVALEMAHTMNLSPVVVMNNLYIIHGRPSWKSEFVISQINASGLFSSPLTYERGSEDGGRCRAYAMRGGEPVHGPWVSMKMAQAEGWTTRKGSKWATMPELMLMYRAATLFARVHAPEVLNGYSVDTEVTDMADYKRESDAVQRLNDLMNEEPAQPTQHEQPTQQADTEPASPDDVITDAVIL
jgi:hypothetical protein